PLPGDGKHKGIDVRGWLCILGGVIAFVVLGRWGGLMPATFASVVVAAMGDRQNTWRAAVLLGAILTVFCLIVFHYGLSLQLPLFQWGG
ncbi:MAG: tripartite tricarboxylate transporter TctB family protein, partial [Rhizobacter sp.]